MRSCRSSRNRTLPRRMVNYRHRRMGRIRWVRWGPWTRRFDVGDATPRFDFASVVVRKLNRRHGFGMPSLAAARQVSGAASLAHPAGADLKTVQEQLGHTSIVLTADTYTSVLADEQHKTAEA